MVFCMGRIERGRARGGNSHAVPALRHFALNVRPGGVGSHCPTWEAGVGGDGCRRSVSLRTFAAAGGSFFSLFPVVTINPRLTKSPFV